MAIVFDLESNGLLPEIHTIHCIVTYDTDTKKYTRFSSPQGNIETGIKLLQDADCIIGHNIIGYDIPAIQKIYPWFKPKGMVRDTLVISRLIWTDLKDRDFRLSHKDPDFPKQLIGRHSLMAWGYRLANLKDDYVGGWESWNQAMEDYCEQDVKVTVSLLDKIVSKEYAEEAIQLEHDVQIIINRQMAHGFRFNVPEARALYVKLVQRQEELRNKLTEVFKPWWSTKGVVTAKRDNKRYGYADGTSRSPIILTEFNPGSRDHIASRLIKIRGWKPKDYGNNGKPNVDETILKKLKYPEIPLLVEYLTVAKRLGQLGEGQQAWLKAERGGVIYGNVNTNGAVTGRMTHNRPNVAQVPSCSSLHGEECRSLFTVRPGYKLVGADASGLELRCLAHYMARWDEGAYAREVLEGDIHTANMNAAGLTERNQAKTFILITRMT